MLEPIPNQRAGVTTQPDIKAVPPAKPSKKRKAKTRTVTVVEAVEEAFAAFDNLAEQYRGSADNLPERFADRSEAFEECASEIEGLERPDVPPSAESIEIELQPVPRETVGVIALLGL